MPQNEEEAIEIANKLEKSKAEAEMHGIATYVGDMLDSLLIYKLAAKILNTGEVNAILDGGSDTIIDQLGDEIGKNKIEKISKDIAQNKKDMIHQMRDK